MPSAADSSSSSPRTTPALIAGGEAAFHLRPEVGEAGRPHDDEVGNPWVSSQSRWRDDRWYLDNATPGVQLKACQVLWRRPLPDGSLLTDPQHARLLDAFRRFLWSLMVDPRSGRGATAGSMGHLSRGIYLLARWMVENDYRHFGQLDGEASAEFEQDLDELIFELRRSPAAVDVEEQDATTDDDDPPEEERDTLEELRDLGMGQTYSATVVWASLWRQSGTLVDAGVPPLPEAPFGGKSALKVAKDLATRKAHQIPPLPDEVAAPIMAAAYRLIGEAAEDVIALQRIYLEARAQHLRWQNDTKGRRAIRDVMEAFRFSTLPGETAPWHEPLREPASGDAVEAGIYNSQAHALRALIRAIREAAVILVQSSSGQRINELCGLPAGVDPGTGLPACIEIRPSHSGLSELFYLRGILSKTRSAPVAAEWLIGSRPARSDWIPPPVRALDVLQRLFKPWREMAESDAVKGRLLLNFAVHAGGGLPVAGSSLGPPTSEKLREGQKDFVRRFVDLGRLPDKNARSEDLARYRDTRGACITTHQWRKTYAIYLFRINSRLLPAISQQFKHLSIAMTERAYIGNDPALLEELDAAHVQQSVAFWAQWKPGQKVPVAGRAGALIKRFQLELEQRLAGLEGDEAAGVIKAWVLRHDMRIFHNPDGKCLIRALPAEARCHEVAGTSHWKNRSPNYGARTTETCLGCNCFAIDGEHKDFYVRRYAENQSAWSAARAAGDTRGYRVVKKRADQAKAVLRVIRVPTPPLEAPDAA